MTGLAIKRLSIQMVFLLGSLSLCVSGCGITGRTVDPNAEAIAIGVSVGDHLLIETKDGVELDFRATDIDESGIWFNERLIPYADIQSLQVKPDRATDSDALVFLVVVAMVVVAVWLVSEIDSAFDDGIFQSTD